MKTTIRIIYNILKEIIYVVTSFILLDLLMIIGNFICPQIIIQVLGIQFISWEKSIVLVGVVGIIILFGLKQHFGKLLLK